MKTTLTTYRHYTNSRHDPKLSELRAQLGHAAEARYYALIGEIASEPYCSLDASDRGKMVKIAEELYYTEEELNEFVKFLLNTVKLLFVTKNGLISSQLLQENLRRTMNLRAAWRRSKKKSQK